MTPRLTIERVAFERDRMAVLVRVPEGPQGCLGPEAARSLCEARPLLARHSCLNAEDAPFGAILPRTSLPHVLEHLIIDFQAEGAKALSGAQPLTFLGTTEWLNEREGLARVEVNFTDDLVALAALKSALELLNEGKVR